MTEKLLAATLEKLFSHIIPLMDNEQPKKLKGEGEKIYCFGFEAFQAGFLYGIQAGLGTADEVSKGENDG